MKDQFNFFTHCFSRAFSKTAIICFMIIVEYKDSRTVHTRQQVDKMFNRLGGIHGLWREAMKIFDTMNFDMSGVTLDSRGNPVLITMLVSGGFANTAGTGLSRTRMSADRDSIPAISFRTVLTLEANSYQAFIFRRNEREAFYIEAQNTGGRPQGIRGRDESGLLIWHINMNAGRSGVGGGGFSRVELVHADGRNDTIDDTDLFRSGVATQFSSASAPAARWHDGTPSNINITGISGSGAVMTFRIGDMPSTPINRLLWQIWPYSSGRGDVVIEVDQNITLSATINIPRPASPGAKITIRSANPSRPVALTRGTSGSLITVSDGAALILENIIIDGGGVTIITNGTFTMSGGVISGNTAGRNGSGIRRGGGTVTINSGLVAGTGANIAAIISGTYNLNTASPNNAVIITWTRPAGTLNYTVGTSTNLNVSPNTARAVWANQSGVLGILYTNGSNTGWIRAW